MNDVIKFLNLKIKLDDKIIIACSGGPDSMCLLSLAMKATKNIIVATVNHNVRENALIEYNYVKDFCQKNDLIFEGLDIKFNTFTNFEYNARKKRYDFFNELMNKYNAKYILTAHHGDDLIETILMRITRGSKLSGYIGIKKENNKYLRPLLYVTKEDIYNYLKENNIDYYVDDTNFSDEHARNRYRKNILPFLKKEDPQVHKKYLKFSEELELYDDFVSSYIKKLNAINNETINIDALKNEKNFIKRKTIELLIKKVQSYDELDINDNTLFSMVKMINSAKSNLKLNLNNGYIAQKDYNLFKIKKELVKDNYCITFDTYFETKDYVIKKVDKVDVNNNYVLRLDSTQVALPLIIRTRKDGDKMFVKNLGTKKVKDILINEKISVEKRDVLPVVTDSLGHILWLPGIKKSKFDIGKNEKCDIILLCERK